MDVAQACRPVGSSFENQKFCQDAEAPIIMAARKGDFRQVYSLYQKGQYPRDAILIGVCVEMDDNADVNPYVEAFFKSLGKATTPKSGLVIPVPMDSTAYHLPCGNALRGYVLRDLEGLDGVVIPGNNFNLPALRADLSPSDAVGLYTGKPHLGADMSIYDESSAGFYASHRDHRLNPDPRSLNYEAELIRVMEHSDRPLMASCHGTQLYAVMHGAHLVADIKGHNDGRPHPVHIDKGSMAWFYAGGIDDVAPHNHRLAIKEASLPSYLHAVGKSDDVVEILENQYHKNHYLYQSHPELVAHHVALKAFVSDAACYHGRDLVVVPG